MNFTFFIIIKTKTVTLIIEL